MEQCDLGIETFRQALDDMDIANWSRRAGNDLMKAPDADTTGAEVSHYQTVWREQL